jgi:hypothetical protein
MANIANYSRYKLVELASQCFSFKTMTIICLFWKTEDCYY